MCGDGEEGGSGDAGTVTVAVRWCCRARWMMGLRSAWTMAITGMRVRVSRA
jgi:hypothetical protein